MLLDQECEWEYEGVWEALGYRDADASKNYQCIYVIAMSYLSSYVRIIIGKNIFPYRKCNLSLSRYDRPLLVGR